MSKSSKSNLGHKRRLTHAQKKRAGLAMRTSEDRSVNTEWRHTLNWRKRAASISGRVKRQIARAKYYSEQRRKERGGKVHYEH